MMRIDVVTIFPDFFSGPLDVSITGRAQKMGIVEVAAHDLRGFTDDPHRTVDDTPYGGGAGMVMKPEPLFRAVEAVRRECGVPVVLFTPQGERLRQEKVAALARAPQLILICGRYEGVDERVRETLVTDEISLGDFVLSGGELAALVLIDAVIRLLPGALGNETSALTESFAGDLLEHPHYTRPAVFRDMPVPTALSEGDHAQVDLWRKRESLRRTLLRRPELLAEADLTPAELKLLAELMEQ